MLCPVFFSSRMLAYLHDDLSYMGTPHHWLIGTGPWIGLHHILHHEAAARLLCSLFDRLLADLLVHPVHHLWCRMRPPYSHLTVLQRPIRSPSSRVKMWAGRVISTTTMPAASLSLLLHSKQYLHGHPTFRRQQMPPE